MDKKGSPSSRTRRVRLRVLLPLFLVAVAAGSLLYLDRVVTRRFEGVRWALPTKVYADSFLFYPGLDLDASGFERRLARLGYRRVDHPPRAGEWTRDEHLVEVYRRPVRFPDREAPAQQLRLELDGTRVARISDPESPGGGEELPTAELEPELLGAFYRGEWEERRLVRLEEVPEVLWAAIVQVEDQRFFIHHGLDPRSIARAVWIDLRRGELSQGGSTLTQQLVKNMFLSQERTWRRKLVEAWMAVLLELHYTKQEILEAYLNEIYLGQRGPIGVFGVGEGAYYYFGKSVRDLDLAESALLAGLIRSPNQFSPSRSPDAAHARRSVVLKVLEGAGRITPEQAREADAESLPAGPHLATPSASPFFMDLVRRQLALLYPEETLTTQGLRVYTTLDPELQQQAERAVREGLAALEEQYPRLLRHGQPEPREVAASQEAPEGAAPFVKTTGLEGALIAIQPQTGQIRVLVGGRDFRTSQFNRVVLAHRQPGSLFKPFVYLAAFETGNFTPATIIEDSPYRVIAGGKEWSPKNYDLVFNGPVRIRVALERSLNAATARLAEQVGLDRVADVAAAAGIQSPLQPVPSLALGTSEVTPFEMAVAYGTLANEGMRVEPIAIRRVIDAAGEEIHGESVAATQVVSPVSAFLVTHLLRGAVDQGTGRGVRALGFDRPVAGKTGTTSDYRDSWFAGYTPDLLAVAWVGFDDGAPLNLTGAQAALPIWTRFMIRATAAIPERDFSPPPGVTAARIDPRTGLLSGPGCPEGVEELFAEGTEPKIACGGKPAESGVMEWFKRLFGR